MASSSALEWRREHLARTEGDERLKSALQMWQGAERPISLAVTAIQGTMLHPVYLMNAAMLLNELTIAPELPVGTVLWHATRPGERINTTGPLATAATREGACNFAVRSDIRAPVIHKLKVTSPGVRALAVGADSDYDDESEILVMPNVKTKTSKKGSHLRLYVKEDV